MPLVSFMHGRRSVVIGGRVFRVSSPTVETVFRLLRLFPGEIEACRMAFAGKNEAVDVALPIFSRHADRFGEVLETCVSGEGPPASWPLEALARETLRDCDVDRILKQFQGGRTDPDEVPPEVVDDDLESVAFCKLARFYDVSPMELAQWPFEAYIAAREAADRMLHGEDKPKRWFMGTPAGDGVSVM